MPKYSFDNFYSTLRELHADFQKQIRTVMENPDLSEQGKARSISTIKAKRTELLSNLKATFEKDVDTKRGILTRKASPKVTPRETLRRRAQEEAETYSSIYSDDVRFNLLIDAVEKVEARFDNFLESWALMQRDEKWFRSQLKAGMKNKDIALLEKLSRAVPLLADGAVSERLSTQFGAVISQLKEEALTPAERASRDELGELEKSVELFNYSVANVDTRNEYVDPRPQEVEPATVLTASNPRLGVSPRSEQFQRYKTGGQGPVEN